METVVSLIAVAVLAAAWFGGKRYWQWRFRFAPTDRPRSGRMRLAERYDNGALARGRPVKAPVDDGSPPCV